MAINLDWIQAPVLDTPTLSSGGNLSPNTTYYYCVVCVGGRDSLKSYLHYFESPRSNIVSITTTSTERTVNLSWTAQTITQSGSYHTALEEHDNYAVLRSTNIEDLQGKEGVPILINSAYTDITTTTNSYTDDNTTLTASGTKSYFWYRPCGCPKIHLTGATEGNPFTMQQLYLADLAGTFELLPEVEAVDSPHRLRTQVRPADSKQLNLTISVTSFTTAGTIELNGRDAGGDAKSETISITGTGDYTTTLSYASIDEDGIVCTGDFRFKIIQPRWGVVEKHPIQFGPTIDNNNYFGTNNWTIHGSFYNETYFLTKKENIFIVGGFNPGINTNSHFTAGVLDASGSGKSGSNITFLCRRWFAGMNNGNIYGMTLYGSKVQYLGSIDSSKAAYTEVASTATWFGYDGDWRLNVYDTVTMIDSVFDIPCGSNGFLLVSPPNIKRGLFVGVLQPRNNNVFDFKGLAATNGQIAHQIDNSPTIKNISLYNASNYHIYLWGSPVYTKNYTYVNVEFYGRTAAEPYNEPYVYNNRYADSTPYWAIFKSTIDIQVLDRNGNPIVGASVKIERSDGITEVDTTTDSDGKIATTEVTYCKWDIDRTKPSAVGYATNNRGNLTPTIAAVVATNYTHTITISKSGYQTKIIKLTLTKKRDEVVVLEKAVPFIVADDIIQNLDKTNSQNKYKWIRV